ncbi:MAG TPA: hypothetical protein VF707_09505 [Ardenticatenaceae bacterium]|jgi:membrane-bound acyltransferase YfiQ involved in biofilm formation
MDDFRSLAVGFTVLSLFFVCLLYYIGKTQDSVRQLAASERIVLFIAAIINLLVVRVLLHEMMQQLTGRHINNDAWNWVSMFLVLDIMARLSDVPQERTQAVSAMLTNKRDKLTFYSAVAVLLLVGKWHVVIDEYTFHLPLWIEILSWLIGALLAYAIIRVFATTKFRKALFDTKNQPRPLQGEAT